MFAKELPRLATFYERLLSMTIVVAEKDHIVLESDVFQLVLHSLPKQVAKSITITSPPTRRTDVPVKLFFPVPSIADARIKAAALGGRLNPESKEWEARGFRACDGNDPEGNIVQFRENAQVGKMPPNCFPE
ncbi:VOC family protein [Pseudolysobacter antarcticus]|uniref:VOC family protein n=1 Tax=Pseudolysobacter antarcticus TaxID=2511995 RepID=UPI001A92F92D|nr:VOC family protein [Pseudolysobacter antarcticus]